MNTMKSQIHPNSYQDTIVTCACGNTFTTSSTQKEIKVDICSNCHPFYTGEQRFVDTQGQVEKFRLKMEAASGYQPKKRSNNNVDTYVSPKSLKEMLSVKKA